MFVARVVVVFACESEGMEVGAVCEGGVFCDLGSETVDGEVVSPDLTPACPREELSLERRLVVDADGVDDAVRFLGYSFKTANPFTTITESTDTLD